MFRYTVAGLRINTRVCVSAYILSWLIIEMPPLDHRWSVALDSLLTSRNRMCVCVFGEREKRA